MFDNAPGLKMELHFPLAAEHPERGRGEGIASDSAAE